MSQVPDIYGKSTALEELLRSAELVAATDVTTLIAGETGTGKELLAQRIHAQSPRTGKAFVAINCGALPEALAESQLFGHKRGAFTDAKESHRGFVAQASGGTLFLDEIGELSLDIQAKLLRFLETGECQPPGYSKPVYHNVRIIAATNRDLAQASRDGSFRQDLYYRLNIVPLELPPLRQRHGDVDILLGSLMHDLVRQYKLTPPNFSKSARRCLQHYDWPGNIRELRNLCERMLILFSGKTVETNNLPAEVLNLAASHRKSPFNLPQSGIKLDSLEADLMQQALSLADGNKSHAAKLLGLSRDTFLYRLKKYAIKLA